MTANPTLLSMPLAQNGQKNVIPTTQATAGDGLFSQSTGFPAETSLPLGAGGVAPSREDFNGLAYLLGGVVFMAQKGFTFNYDATQDYYSGCIVTDPNDGLRYECIADMAAGTIAPSADTTNTYWTIFKSGLDREQIPAFNRRDVITTSGNYTAPVTGWYKITAKGGGGGGNGAYRGSPNCQGGGGGGEGGTTIIYLELTAGDSVDVVIGAGGAGGLSSINGGGLGGAGGDTRVTYDGNVYTAGGGRQANAYEHGGLGGTGTIQGASGTIGSWGTIQSSSVYRNAGTGGGAGGSANITSTGTAGGGGCGGNSLSDSSVYSDGTAGGDGYVWFEYFATI